MSEWKDIKDAPRDGTRLLGYYSTYDGMKIDVLYWDCDYSWDEDEAKSCGWTDGSFDRDDRYFFYEPTHFMPLPQPPISEDI